MLYNPFFFQSYNSWDTDDLYWCNEFYAKKPVWTSLKRSRGPQKTGPRWFGSVPSISWLVLDRLRSTVARFGGKKPDWTGLANTIEQYILGFQFLASWGGYIMVGQENPCLLEMFLDGLNMKLWDKIKDQKEPPKTLSSIIEDARKFEKSYYRKTMKARVMNWQLNCPGQWNTFTPPLVATTIYD